MCATNTAICVVIVRGRYSTCADDAVVIGSSVTKFQVRAVRYRKKRRKLTANRDGVDESMLFRGANPLAWAGLAVGKTGVTGALPRRSPQAFS